MTLDELKEYRRLRRTYIHKGTRRVLYRSRYRELEKKYMIAMTRLDGIWREIIWRYYYQAQSIVYISMHLNFSDCSVKRIKANALRKIVTQENDNEK